MVDLEKIDQVIIDTMKTNITEIKTVDTYDGSFDEKSLDSMLVTTPFILGRFLKLGTLEDQKINTGQSTVKGLRYGFVIGAKSLQSRSAQKKGCYKIWKEIDDLIDGKRLTVDSVVLPAFEFESLEFGFNYKGLTVYFSTYTMSLI